MLSLLCATHAQASFFSTIKNSLAGFFFGPPKKTIKTMNLQELEQKKNELIAANDKLTAIKYAEKMIPMCNDLDERGVIMLELADLYFDTGNLKRAETLYKEFAALYPNYKINGEDLTEKALYKEIMCAFFSILDADRDQTKTKETIALTDAFLGRAVFTTYKKDVENIKKQCCRRNIDSEIGIVNYYIHRGSVRAAEHRIAKMEQHFSTQLDFLPEAPDLINDLKTALFERKRESGMQTTPVLIAQKEQTIEDHPTDKIAQNKSDSLNT